MLFDIFFFFYLIKSLNCNPNEIKQNLGGKKEFEENSINKTFFLFITKPNLVIGGGGGELYFGKDKGIWGGINMFILGNGAILKTDRQTENTNIGQNSYFNNIFWYLMKSMLIINISFALSEILDRFFPMHSGMPAQKKASYESRWASCLLKLEKKIFLVPNLVTTCSYSRYVSVAHNKRCNKNHCWMNMTCMKLDLWNIWAYIQQQY